MTPKVLISDKLSPLAQRIFEEREIETEIKVGLEVDELLEIIPNYHGLAIRSATKVTENVISHAKNLKVVGRAGIGVDNIDINAATTRGIIVMNTPFGNSITTAEHAISMMMALARNIPNANSSTHSGKWEKSKFMGVELTSKILGIIGCGNIGSIVADRAIGLKMKVIAYDPFLTQEHAIHLGVEKVELDELLKRADFISLHTPLTEKTRNIINAETIQKTKQGVRIINCARGGLVVEKDLKDALDSGHVAGAAMDVFEQEPATENILFSMPNVICTPHLGASTLEAQENVAIQVAEQMSDYLLTGAITNAINFPSISAEEAPKLKPFITLSEKLGSFAGQLIETGLKNVRIEFSGDTADMNKKALTSAIVSGVLRPMLQDINMVSALSIAKDRGISIEEVTKHHEAGNESSIRLIVQTERQERSVTGTVFADGKPRLLDISDIKMDAELGKYMLYTENADKPGYIGALGSLLGQAQVNIATFHLGRSEQGGKAIALVETDTLISNEVLQKVTELEHVFRAKRLSF